MRILTEGLLLVAFPVVLCLGILALPFLMSRRLYGAVDAWSDTPVETRREIVIEELSTTARPLLPPQPYRGPDRRRISVPISN